MQQRDKESKTFATAFPLGYHNGNEDTQLAVR